MAEELIELMGFQMILDFKFIIYFVFSIKKNIKMFIVVISFSLLSRNKHLKSARGINKHNDEA